MKKTFKKATLVLVLCAGYTFLNNAQAQNTGWGEGSKLQDAEVVVEKNRVIELPQATRNFEKFKIKPPVTEDRNVRYRFTDYTLPSQEIKLQVKVLTIKQDELTKLYGNYLKGGLGNYASIYLKGYFHNKRSDDVSYGAEVSHVSSARGPVDNKNSAVGNSSIGLHGEKYLSGLTVGGRVGYGRDTYHFYGYNSLLEQKPEKDAIRQVFNRVNADAYLHNEVANTPFVYRAGVKLNYLNDKFDMSETNAAFALKSEYGIDAVSAFKVDADASFVTHKDDGSVSRGFFKLTPAYERQLNALRLTIGAQVAYTADTVNSPKQFNLYPALRVGVEPIKDNLLFYAGLGGGLERVTLYDLTQENPYLAQNVAVADINKGLEIYGGLSANIANYVHLTGRVAYQNFRNMYFYNNSFADPSKFELVYDDGVTNVLNLYAEAVFNYSDEVRLGLKTDYNKYSTASLEKAFHRPALITTVFGTYNFYDKILFNSELYYIGSSYGQVFNTETNKPELRETDTIVDLNVKADYLFSKRFTVFLMGNNLLARKYERFVNYPVKSINLIGGVTYSF
jgi:hypothetical protein